MVFGACGWPSAGVFGDHLWFITKPPAAMMTDFALTAPVSVKCFQATPATAPDGVQDQIGGPGLVPDLHAQVVGAFDQQVDHHGGAAEFAGHRHRVAARRRDRLLAERPHLLVAGVASGPRCPAGTTTLPG